MRVATLTAQGIEIAPTTTALKLGARQRDALDLLRGAPDGVDARELATRRHRPQTLARLAELGLVTIARRRVERDPFDAATSRADAVDRVVLTAEQAAALDAAARAGRHARRFTWRCCTA